jgi:hypothetical protein
MPKISRPTRPLADVNVLPRRDGSHEIVVCFMPDPDILFGGEANSRAFLALDASASLKKMYGFGGPFGGDPNYMQAVARKLGATLASVTKTGKVVAAYWAVSPEGNKVEPIGEFDEAGWQHAVIKGPRREKWGKGTRLLPAFEYCAEQVAAGAAWTIGVFVTDGIIEDEADCISYCQRIGREMAMGRRKPIKLILIGIGEEVDKAQFERFDDMFDGSGVEYDLFSHGLVASMQDEFDILATLYGELMTEDTIVAGRAWVEDAYGSRLRNYSDGMPGKFRFDLPRGHRSFVIRMPDRTITQDISEALS